MIRVGEKRKGAVGGKTARACDICVRKRARWYCAADDAFLCQVCDESVHSANPLARRHDRLRLNTASLRHYSSLACKQQLPTWHRGPTRKPRTPRQRKKHHHHHQQQQNHPVVPELDTWMDEEEEEDEDQLLCRVPVYDHHSCPLVFPGPSELDMAEFAADVEALLGKGLDGDHNCGIEDLGLLINSPAASAGVAAGAGAGAAATTTTVADCGMLLKLENEEEMEVFGEPFQLTFDYDSPEEGDYGDVKDSVCRRQLQGIIDSNKQRKMLLKLDYDAISTAWGSQGSPWINGNRPSDIINPDYCSHLTPTGGYGIEMKAYYGEAAIRGDVGREARVSRYREKRRTRLFSKKIRYEVRKLNAEKRPRMKGRFVKRSSFPLLTNSE